VLHARVRWVEGKDVGDQEMVRTATEGVAAQPGNK